MCPLILPTGCDVLCFDTVDFFLSHSLFFFFFFKLNIFYCCTAGMKHTLFM